MARAKGPGATARYPLSGAIAPARPGGYTPRSLEWPLTRPTESRTWTLETLDGYGEPTMYELTLYPDPEWSEDTADLGPRDLIDLQSFPWVMGSDEYPD